MDIKLDKKDYDILRELDKDFRQPFSKIAKKVKLSKNSVALRFERLKEEVMMHNIVGIDNELLGYKMVKVFYSLTSYDDKVEEEIIKEVKKHKNILWAARFYGPYDLGICLLVNNMDDLITQVSKFDEKFSKIINQKEIEIINKQLYFRYNFIHEKPLNKIYIVAKSPKTYLLTNIEKKIITTVRYNPRMSLIDLASKTRLHPKTIASNLRSLEKRKIIPGYYMTLDLSKFNLDTFKLLIQVQNLKDSKEFEDYLSSVRETKYITKMLGLWDYEVDFMCENIQALQKLIDDIKRKFPNKIKNKAIVSFSKRLVTNKERFLV